MGQHNFFIGIAIAVLICVYYVNGTVNERGLSTKGSEEIGPIDNYTCIANGAFEVENCELYVTCWEGEAILHRCTDTMLFDLRYHGCEIAEYVDCEDRIRPPTYPGTVTPKATTTTVDPTATAGSTVFVSSTIGPNDTFICPSNGVFPHEKKCEYYWSCFDDSAVLIHCDPYDHLFDLRYNGCNFPEYVDCGDRERPPGSASTTPSTTTPRDNSTTTLGSGFNCPDRNGMFPHPDDCTKYYSCEENIATEQHCPDGLHFNPILELCDWPESAGCQAG